MNNFLEDLLSEAWTDQPIASVLSALSKSAITTLGSADDDLLQLTTEDNNNIVVTGGGSDVISISGNNNIIVTTDADSRGNGEQDYVSLGEGNDIVVLGDSQGSYFSANGWDNSLYIDNFDINTDALVMFGSSELYRIDSDATGSWILWGEDQTTAIAYLHGISNFDLNSANVSYISPDTSTAEPATLFEATLDLEPAPAKAQVLAETAAQTETPKVPEVTTIQTKDAELSAEFYEQLGQTQYKEVIGSPGDNALVGSAETADKILGFGGNDYAYGGGGGDLFVLGDFGSSYYAQKGWGDSIYIEGFQVGIDQLQLSGSRERYTTDTENDGTWLYDQGDAIAYLQDVTTLDLNRAQYLAL